MSLITAQRQLRALSANIPELVGVLEQLQSTERVLNNALDSLEYVNHAHPDATGWGVRAERINEIRRELSTDALVPDLTGAIVEIDPSPQNEGCWDVWARWPGRSYLLAIGFQTLSLAEFFAAAIRDKIRK